MSNYSVLKQDINNNIYENQTQQITGTVLNAILNEMTASLGAGYQFAGVATLGMNPGDPDQRVFYLAGEGIYTNFGGLQVPQGKLGVLKWDFRWTLQTIDGLGGGGANLTGYVSLASTDDLPEEGQPTLGYLCGTNLYLYVGTGGDTKEGKYQNCGSFRGPQGLQGDPGVGIATVTQTTTSTEDEGINVITVTKEDGTQSTFQVRNGSKGSQGIQGPQGVQGEPGRLQAQYKEVETLPTASADTVDYIYLVASQTPNTYDMYYTEENQGAYSWKSLGTTAVQLSDYATKAEVNQLEAKVGDLYGETRVVDMSGVVGYAIATNGGIAENAGYTYTNPILLLKGQTISFRIGTASIYCALAKVEGVGTGNLSYSQLIQGSSAGSNVPVNYTYTATEDCYVCISYRNGYNEGGLITSDGIEKKILEEIGPKVDGKFQVAYKSGAINFTSGRTASLVGSGNLTIHCGGTNYIIPENSTFTFNNIDSGTTSLWAIVFDTSNLTLVAKPWSGTTENDKIIATVAAGTQSITQIIHCVIPYTFNGKYLTNDEIAEIRNSGIVPPILLKNNPIVIDSAQKTISTGSGSDLICKLGATIKVLGEYTKNYSDTPMTTSLYYVVFDYDNNQILVLPYNNVSKYPVLFKMTVQYGTLNILDIYDCAVPVTLDGNYFSPRIWSQIQSIGNDAPEAYSEGYVKGDYFVSNSYLNLSIWEKFKLHYTHDGMGNYTPDNQRNAVLVPMCFPFSVHIQSDGSHDFAVQFYDGPITGSSHLVEASAWVNTYNIESGRYWCIIVRNNNWTETTQETTRALRFTGISDGQVLVDLEDKCSRIDGNNKPYTYFGENIRLNRFNIKPFSNISNAWAQSMAIYGDYVIFFSNETQKAQLYRISSDTLLATFDIPNGGYFAPHCNTAMCGVEFATQNSIMPVIYLSQWDTGHERACFVLDVSYTDNSYVLTLVQKINLSSVSSSIIGAGECDFVVDRTRNKLIAISYKTSVYSAYGTATMVCEMDLPLLSAGAEVIITDSEIGSYFETEIIKYRQDAFMLHDNIFICCGGLSDVPGALKVVNIYKKAIITDIPLSSYRAGEPECLDLYNGEKILFNYGTGLLELVV